MRKRKVVCVYECFAMRQSVDGNNDDGDSALRAADRRHDRHDQSERFVSVYCGSGRCGAITRI